MAFDATREMAYAVARVQPDDHGRSFFPPQLWGLNAEGNMYVIGADGRKVVATMEEIKRLFPEPKKAEAPKLMALPVHVDTTLPPANLRPDGKRKPANHKAGK